MKILITVNGGCVSAVYVKASSPVGDLTEVVVCDYDHIDADAVEHDTWFSNGQSVYNFLEQVRINPENYRRVL